MNYTIKRPIITEKNSMLAERGVYVFEVETKASKIEIKEAVEKFFRVKVDRVRTSVCRKRTKSNRNVKGSIRYWKKAMVQLQTGEKISLFEGA
jgi:large subunit ribosomal protein L23